MEKQTVPFLCAFVRVTILSAVFEWRRWIRWFPVKRGSTVARHLLGSAVHWPILVLISDASGPIQLASSDRSRKIHRTARINSRVRFSITFG